jgi:molybdopterin synthase catalytic subunit
MKATGDRTKAPAGDPGPCFVSARITEEPIQAERLLDLGSRADGALLLFVGRVRNHNDGRPVARLRYEAYTEMAERELEAILREAADRCEATRIEAVHRTGTLEIGEASVAIAVASPHRASAFEASRYVIEEIKKRLPVWKREVYADGSDAWVHAASEDPPR